MKQLVFDVVLELFGEFHGAILVDDEMGRKGIFGRADRPDMDMVEVLYPLHFVDGIADLFDLDAGRHPIERKTQAVAQQLPGAEEDDEGDEQAQGRVDPKQVCIKDDKPANYEGGRYYRIG